MSWVMNHDVKVVAQEVHRGQGVEGGVAGLGLRAEEGGAEKVSVARQLLRPRKLDDQTAEVGPGQEWELPWPGHAGLQRVLGNHDSHLAADADTSWICLW